jgi:hypothetical protein
LSRLLLDDAFQGEEREAVLLDSRGRLGAPLLLLFGLGDSGRLDRDRLRALLEHLAGVVARARWESAAVEIPDRRLGSVDAAAVAALWLSALARHPPAEGAVLLRSTAAQEEHLAAMAAQDERLNWQGSLQPSLVRA